jgi:hypothetical protein
MKKLLSVILISVFLATTACAEELILANSVNVTWDEAKFLYDGELVPSTDTLSYRLYLAPSLPAENPILLGEASDLFYTITFSGANEGWFYLGLQTVRRVAGGAEVNCSVIGWSNDPLIVFEGKTFKIGYFRPPKNATGLRVVEGTP